MLLFEEVEAAQKIQEQEAIEARLRAEAENRASQLIDTEAEPQKQAKKEPLKDLAELSL